MRSILERYKKLVFKAKIRRYIKIFQEFSTQKTGFLSVPKQVRIAPVRLASLYPEKPVLTCTSLRVLDRATSLDKAISLRYNLIIIIKRRVSMQGASKVFKGLMPYLSIFLFSILGTWLFLYSGLNIGDDYYYHLPAILDKYENGFCGISSSLADGIGYGAGLYYSPLSHYTIVIIAKVVSVFGVSLMSAYKLTFILSVFLSGVFMYRLALSFTGGNRVASIISSAFLVLYPYRLFNLFCRLAVAEAFAFTLVPLFFWGLYEVTHIQSKEIKMLPFLRVVLGASLLFLSHNLTALFVFIVGVLYLLCYAPRLFKLFKKGRFTIYAISSIFLIVGLCAFSLFAQIELLGSDIYAITDQSIMRTDVEHVISHVGKEWYYSGFLNISFLNGLGHSSSSIYTGIALFLLGCFIFVIVDRLLCKVNAFSKIYHYFASAPILFIVPVLAYGRIEICLGSLVFLCLYVFISEGKEKEEKPIFKSVLFWFSLAVIIFVLWAMSSVEFWENAPDFLLKIQFPWRFWSLVQIFASILVGLLSSYFAKRRLALCFISVFVGLLIVLNMPILEKRSEGDDEWQEKITLDYLDNISSLGHHKEYAPTIFQKSDYVPEQGSLYYAVKDVLYNRRDNNLSPVFLTGEGELLQFSSSAPSLNAKIKVSSDAKIQLPLLYYSGYKIYATGEDGTTTELDAIMVDGLVSFELEDGTYDICVRFTGSPLRICGRVLSIVCVVIVLGALGYAIYKETGIKNIFKRKR